jgi:hypothetical protein
LQVCTALQEYSKLRTFWLRLLKRIALRRPLPCPVAQDLSLLDDAELRALAQRAYRLERAVGRSETTFPRHTTHTLASGLIAAQPICGTELVLFFDDEARSLVCCNFAMESETLASQPVHVGRLAIYATDAVPTAEGYLIAVFASNQDDLESVFLRTGWISLTACSLRPELCVFAITVTEEHPDMQLLRRFTVQRSADFGFSQDIFLDGPVAGCVVVSQDGAIIQAWNVYTGAHVAHEVSLSIEVSQAS